MLTRIRNALAFLVELKMREMVRDAREYELKALLTDPFGQRMAAATVERLHARMGTAARTPISANPLRHHVGGGALQETPARYPEYAQD